MKGLLVAKGEDPETFRKRYGHTLCKLWEQDAMTQVRNLTKATAVHWTYPEHWAGSGDKFTLLEDQLEWLSNVQAGRSIFEKRIILRYPDSERNEFIPPTFLIDAARTIPGTAEDEIYRAQEK